MADSSRVSLAFGIEVDAWPLIYRCLYFSSFHHAEIFFALLSHRARTSTLAFTDLALRAATIASLPVEIRSLILDALFDLFIAQGKSTVGRTIGGCYTSRWLEGQPRSSGIGLIEEHDHVCGLDCPSWFECCCSVADAYPYALTEIDIDRYHELKSGTELQSWISKVQEALATYDLALLSKSVVLPSDGPFRCIVGLPLLQSPINGPQAVADAHQTAFSMSQIEATDDSMDGSFDAVHRVSMAPLVVTAKERQRFVRARRLLTPALPKGQATPPEKADQKQAATASMPRRQPGVLLIHESSGVFY